MAVSYGFYNSVNGDRKYDARQFSSIFDGIILDGIFSSIGTGFVVKASSGLILHVGVGRAWFKGTWTLNDAVLSLIAPASENTLDRIDAVVIEVNTSEAVRENSIKYIKGPPGSSPVAPEMANTSYLHQYPLCHIRRKAGYTEIKQADITNLVGTSSTPFVSGALQPLDLDLLLGQWRSELDEFAANEEADFESWSSGRRSAMEAIISEFSTEKTNFIAWYNAARIDVATLQTFDFDNLSELRGIVRTTTFPGETVFEELRKSVGNNLVASRLTVFNSDGSITATVKVYKENGVDILRQSVITTIFNTDGSVSEEVV